MLKRTILATTLSLAIAGCNSSDSGPTTAVGQFKDSNTAGLKYVSGDQSGITGADGSFTYEIGETVTFSIGGVTIGTSNGKSIITPIDLISAGSSSSIQVQNIVRFLIMLDNDGIPLNGINISASVQTVADTWPQVDFNTANLSLELTSIISDAASADGGIHTLPDGLTAQAHLESTLRCSYTGAYQGIFSGDDIGTFGFLIDTSNGNVTGITYSELSEGYTNLSGITPVSYDQNVSFVSGDGTTSFGGNFTSVDSVSGVWQQGGAYGGNFIGSRIGGARNAVYRYTGNYTGDGKGLFSFDIDSADAVTGIAYNVTANALFSLSGLVTGTNVTATASDGTALTGTLDVANGTLFGSYTSGGFSGTFAGSGCKLN